jgi:hypothetical protein
MKRLMTISIGALLLAQFGVGTAHAADCNNAVVIQVLADSTHCGNGASFSFKTDKSNTWLCVSTATPTSDSAKNIDSLVLAAFLSGKPVDYTLSATGTCDGGTNYSRTVTLLFMHN